MTTYTYAVETENNVVTVRINTGNGDAVAKIFRLPGGISKFESFSAPKAARKGGLSYALMKVLLDVCQDKIVKIEGVHGFLHYTLKNLKMAHGPWRADPSYKGEKEGDVVLSASMPKQARDYVTHTPDIALWLATLKLVEKSISLRAA